MARYLKIASAKKENRDLPTNASLLCCREILVDASTLVEKD
jgi:hypothetical protein